MKRICALTMVVLFLAGGISAFAVEPVTGRKDVIKVVIEYNIYGVGTDSIQQTTTTTTTEANGQTSTETSITVTDSDWVGGSLKPVKSTTTSTRTSSDGTETISVTNRKYIYDTGGRLIGVKASGTTSSTTKDSTGKVVGTYEGTTEYTYTIVDGQELLKQVKATGVNYGPDKTKTSDSEEITVYEHALKGGSWQVVKETSTEKSNGIDGSGQTIAKTKTYKRDANGVCTGITQTASGTRTIRGDTGGLITYEMKNYKAVFAFDAKMGWHLKKESWEWVDVTPQSQGSGSGGSSESASATEPAAEPTPAPTPAPAPAETDSNNGAGYIPVERTINGYTGPITYTTYVREDWADEIATPERGYGEPAPEPAPAPAAVEKPAYDDVSNYKSTSGYDDVSSYKSTTGYTDVSGKKSTGYK